MENRKDREDQKKKAKREKQKQKKEEKKKEMEEASKKNEQELDTLLELIRSIHVSDVALNNIHKVLRTRKLDEPKTRKFRAITNGHMETLDEILMALSHNFISRIDEPNKIDLPPLPSKCKPPRSLLVLPGSSSSPLPKSPIMEFGKDISGFPKQPYPDFGFQFGTFESLDVEDQEYRRLGISTAQEGGDHEQGVARSMDDERSTGNQETSDDQEARKEGEESKVPMPAPLTPEVMEMLGEYGSLMVQGTDETKAKDEETAELIRRRKMRAEALRDYLATIFKKNPE